MTFFLVFLITAYFFLHLRFQIMNNLIKCLHAADLKLKSWGLLRLLCSVCYFRAVIVHVAHYLFWLLTGKWDTPEVSIYSQVCNHKCKSCETFPPLPCRTAAEAMVMNPPEPTKEKEKQGFFRAIKKKKKKTQIVRLLLLFFIQNSTKASSI